MADTPLCRLDEAILREVLPEVKDAPKKDPRDPDWKVISPNPQRLTEQEKIDERSIERPTVLDFGCGSGRAALPLAQRGYQLVGIDLSRRMLQILSAKADEEGLSVQPLQANLVQLDCLAENSADHGICLFSTLGMIQGRSNRQTMLKHANRIIRPGGSLLLHVHNRWAALREHRGISGLLRSKINSFIEQDADFGDSTYRYRGLEKMFMHRYSKRELLGDLKKSGWNVSQIWPVSIDGSAIAAKWEIPGGFLCHASS